MLRCLRLGQLHQHMRAVLVLEGLVKPSPAAAISSMHIARSLAASRAHIAFKMRTRPGGN